LIMKFVIACYIVYVFIELLRLHLSGADVGVSRRYMHLEEHGSKTRGRARVIVVLF
jgi:hypothetical protein